VNETAQRHAGHRPQLDEISRTAIDEAHAGIHVRTAEPLQSAQDEPEDGPDAVLWEMLTAAPDEGIPVSHLMVATGMSRPWIYQRLRDLANGRRVIQVSRGRWRAPRPTPKTDHPE
jgi:predicted DNA-binding transcriptional regulator AlpA